MLAATANEGVAKGDEETSTTIVEITFVRQQHCRDCLTKYRGAFNRASQLRSSDTDVHSTGTEEVPYNLLRPLFQMRLKRLLMFNQPELGTLTVLAVAVAHIESSGQNLVLSQWVQLGRPNRCPAETKKISKQSVIATDRPKERRSCVAVRCFPATAI